MMCHFLKWLLTFLFLVGRHVIHSFFKKMVESSFRYAVIKNYEKLYCHYSQLFYANETNKLLFPLCCSLLEPTSCQLYFQHNVCSHEYSNVNPCPCYLSHFGSAPPFVMTLPALYSGMSHDPIHFTTSITIWACSVPLNFVWSFQLHCPSHYLHPV